MVGELLAFIPVAVKSSNILGFLSPKKDFAIPD